MSKIDKVKEQINMLKFWLGLVMASFLAIIGWAITNYTKIQTWLLCVSFACIVCLGICAWLISKYITRKINDLEDL